MARARQSGCDLREASAPEIQRLERKQRLLQMTRELQRDEAALAAQTSESQAAMSSGSKLTGLGGACQNQNQKAGIDPQMLSMMKHHNRETLSARNELRQNKIEIKIDVFDLAQDQPALATVLFYAMQ